MLLKHESSALGGVGRARTVDSVAKLKLVEPKKRACSGGDGKGEDGEGEAVHLRRWWSNVERGDVDTLAYMQTGDGRFGKDADLSICDSVDPRRLSREHVGLMR
jgi:hypothetical protein